jgi:hypothetical protein
VTVVSTKTKLGIKDYAVSGMQEMERTLEYLGRPLSNFNARRVPLQAPQVSDEQLTTDRFVSWTDGE